MKSISRVLRLMERSWGVSNFHSFLGHNFPVEGRVYFIQTPKTEEEMTAFLNSDPYVKDNKVVEKFEVSNFEYDGVREFHFLSDQFLYRG
jgi:hypothetical protein